MSVREFAYHDGGAMPTQYDCTIQLRAMPLDSGGDTALPAAIPALTAGQMREVDRAMVEDFHIVLVQMMENAGRALAELAIRRFAPRSVIVLAGPGGNGGGGLVAARHLANRGRAVRALLARRRGEMSETTAHQLDILERMGVAVVDAAGDLDAALSADADLIIDAVIGYSLRGAPRDGAASLIRRVNARSAPVLSLDTPSGLDVTSGTAADPCMRATATMTLALPKIGLIGASQVGELYLADISVPRTLYRRMGIEVGDLFAQDSIIRVQSTSPTVAVDVSGRTGERQC